MNSQSLFQSILPCKNKAQTGRKEQFYGWDFHMCVLYIHMKNKSLVAVSEFCVWDINSNCSLLHI